MREKESLSRAESVRMRRRQQTQRREVKSLQQITRPLPAITSRENMALRHAGVREPVKNAAAISGRIITARRSNPYAGDHSAALRSRLAFAIILHFAFIGCGTLPCVDFANVPRIGCASRRQ